MFLFNLAQMSDKGYAEACGCCITHKQCISMCNLMHNEYISLMSYAHPSKANALIAKLLDKTMGPGGANGIRDPSKYVMGCARAARDRLSKVFHAHR